VQINYPIMRDRQAIRELAQLVGEGIMADAGRRWRTA
jgi:hypothetical protein